MKKIIFYISTILLLAASCSKSGTAEENGSRIRFDLFFSGSGQTRVSANAFEDGDVTGLYLTEYDNSNLPVPLQVSGNAVNNAALRFDGSSWSTSPILYWDKGVKYDVYGYYPYAKPASVDEYRFSVAADQSGTGDSGTLGGYEASDFLWAKQTGVKYPNVVKLKFSHRMSRLVVNLVKGEEFEGNIPNDVVVRIHGTVPDALIDLGSGVVVKDNHSQAQAITMKKESDAVFSAIVVPQRIDSRQPLVEVLTNGISYLMESRFVFRSGVQHSVNIVLTNDPAKSRIEIGGELKGWN